MDHLAILDKKRKLLQKIISGEKTIESRWYKFKKTPYQQIKTGDTIYFKDSGEPVNVKAKVSKTFFFDNLDESKIKNIITQYGERIGISISSVDRLVGKNFCTLMFLENVEQIPPFEVNKKGYGMMAAWITVDNIEKIKGPITSSTRTVSTPESPLPLPRSH